MLLVLFRAVMTARECEDQRGVALQLAEPPHGFSVIGELVVGKEGAGDDVGTHCQAPLCGFAVKRCPMCHLSRPSKSLVDPLVEEVPPRSDTSARRSFDLQRLGASTVGEGDP